MKAFCILTISLIVTITNCQFTEEKCPDIATENFDLSPFAGLWYNLYDINLLNEVTRECDKFKFTAIDNKSLDVYNFAKKDGQLITRKGILKVKEDDPEKYGKLTLNYFGEYDIDGEYFTYPPIEYKVILVNYNYYALISTCVIVNGTARLGSQILSRQPDLHSYATIMLTEYFNSRNDSEDLFHWMRYHPVVQFSRSCWNSASSAMSIFKIINWLIFVCVIFVKSID